MPLFPRFHFSFARVALILCFAPAFIACNRNDANKIKLKGSDTVMPLAQNEAEDYMNRYPEASITVVGGGSGVGISALLSSTTDIAMSSRDLKLDEKLRFHNQGLTIESMIPAYDALAVVVNPANPVRQLTRAQLEDIFTGKVKNWKDVGGPDMEISVYSRESSSGTYEFFKDKVLQKKNFASDALALTSTGAIVQSLENNKGSIAYIGLAYLKNGTGMKALGVKFEDDSAYVWPTMANAIKKTYPITRPLFYFYDRSHAAKVAPFLNYTLSKEGQALVEKIGYVPVGEEEAAARVLPQ